MVRAGIVDPYYRLSGPEQGKLGGHFLAEITEYRFAYIKANGDYAIYNADGKGAFDAVVQNYGVLHFCNDKVGLPRKLNGDADVGAAMYSFFGIPVPE
jgi:hypothetical protein